MADQGRFAWASPLFMDHTDGNEVVRERLKDKAFPSILNIFRPKTRLGLEPS